MDLLNTFVCNALPEDQIVQLLAAKLIKEHNIRSVYGNKTFICSFVRDSDPPHGMLGRRQEAVLNEVERQLRVRRDRKIRKAVNDPLTIPFKNRRHKKADIVKRYAPRFADSLKYTCIVYAATKSGKLSVLERQRGVYKLHLYEMSTGRLTSTKGIYLATNNSYVKLMSKVVFGNESYINLRILAGDAVKLDRFSMTVEINGYVYRPDESTLVTQVLDTDHSNNRSQ